MHAQPIVPIVNSGPCPESGSADDRSGASGDLRCTAMLAAPILDMPSLLQAVVDDLLIALPTAAAIVVAVSVPGFRFRIEREGRLGALARAAEGELPDQILTIPIGQPAVACGSLVIRFAPPFRPDRLDRRFAQLVTAVIFAGLSRIEAEESRHRFDATFSRAPVGIAHVGLDGRFLLVNEQFSRITGYPGAELMRHGFQRITHPDDLDVDMAHVEDLIHGRAERYMMEKRYLRPSGEEVWVNLTVSIVRTASGAPDFFVSVIEDVSEIKRAHAEALRDPLTGLLNRRGLMGILDTELARTGAADEPATLLYLDLDDFKDINDGHGHAEGDRCLIAVARALTDIVDASGTVARVGGDELVILLPGRGLREGFAVSRRVKARLADLPRPGGVGMRSSIGVAAKSAGQAIAPTELLRLADQAMYAAKRSGKNRARSFRAAPAPAR